MNTTITTPQERTGGQHSAKAEAEKAIALAPDLPEARTSRGTFRMTIDHDWSGARADLEAAVALAPGDAVARAWQGQLFAAFGKLPEAIAVTRKAVALDPLDPLAWDYLGRYLAASGQRAASASRADRSCGHRVGRGAPADPKRSTATTRGRHAQRGGEAEAGPRAGNRRQYLPFRVAIGQARVVEGHVSEANEQNVQPDDGEEDRVAAT